MRSKTAPVVLAVLLLGACGAHRSGPAPYDRDRISIEEMESLTAARTAYDVVQQLRPTWFNARGQTGFRTTTPVVVYVAGAKAGGVDRLRDVKRADVLELKHLDGVTATQLYGTGHGSGAILVMLRPGL